MLGHAIREEPRIFTVGVAGSVLFGLLTVGSAYVVGAVVGGVVIPMISSGRVEMGLLALGAASLLAVSVLKVVGIFGRRLGAGYMQYRL
ncbi:MAG: ABC transporter permease, partial [Actinobacteria bacterium]